MQQPVGPKDDLLSPAASGDGRAPLAPNVDPKDASFSEGPLSASERHRLIAEQARSLMEENIENPLTIDQISLACASSPTVLKESFRQVFGAPVYRWYRELRISRAQELLVATDLTIAEVASAVGYSNPSKFSKAFRDCSDMTPNAWRAANRA